MGRHGGAGAGAPARTGWCAHPACRVCGLQQGLLAIAIAATAFRRGDRWAWWSLLVGNTIAFGAAMTYDRAVSAIGPFELSEYLGLTLVYAALLVTAPFLAAGRQGGRTS